MTDTIRFQQEYKTSSNETISIQFDMGKDRWEVACWKNEECRWYKEFADTSSAIKEYERLKQSLAASSAINAQLIIAKDKSELENKELRNDKRWLQTLVQELSAAINAGAREGNFPRR